MVRYVINVKDGTKIPYTAAEEAAADKEKNDARVPLKLGQIRVERDSKLKETDVWVLKGTITDEQKTYRENLRNIPQDYTTEAKYDELLAKDDTGKLTHAVWSKP